MIPSELERLVKERFEMGHRPYFVNCTEGTTVVGAFDPIHPIADICDKYGLWLHIDVSKTPPLLHPTPASFFLSSDSKAGERT